MSDLVIWLLSFSLRLKAVCLPVTVMWLVQMCLFKSSSGRCCL